MNNDEKILHILETLQADITAMKTTQQAQGNDIQELKHEIERVELKVEAVHEYQKKAHTEIMEKLVESNELNRQEVKKLEKRVDHIEKHLDLSPHEQ